LLTRIGTEALVSGDVGEVEMAKEFSLTIEQSEDGNLVAILPELEGYRIEAKSLEELMSKLKEVLALCLKPEEE
jgi:predicted RNase H-like HicB family nuclease